MHNIWVACDWHLFNREVEPRHPFRSTRNIGKLGDHYADMIQDDDLFIYLGDLCDPEVTDKEALTTIIKSIPGYKVLCMGNHDNQDIVYYYDIGFDKVCDVLRIHNLLFSHKPIRVAPDELNIHGHLHTEKLSSLDYQHINAYASNYNRDDQPILLDDLIDSAMIQDPEVINNIKSLNQIQEKFEKYTSIVSGEKYRDIYDLSDKISLSPVDESLQPSIVSLSASVEEDEPVQKKRQRPIDEILFPDVDSTRYFEADDDAANKREDGAKYGDDRPVHKVIHKNDVVADGEANLDESSTPQILLKASSMTGKDKYLSIIAKDLFDEHARIVPELFEQKKLETIDTVKELIAYFYKVTLPHSTMDIGGRQIENTILGAYLYRQTINSDTGLTEDDIKTFFGENLTDGNVKVYVRQCIDRLNKIELAVCGLLIANLKMIRLSIDSVCCDILDPNVRKDLIKRAKEYIDKNQDDFIKTESDGSVAFCYNDFGINHQVFISKEMYNNKAVKKNMRPSRFLARLGLYDYIIVAHGHTVSYENGKYKWNIEPITVEGCRFTDLDDLIRYLKETNVDARILVISCNEAHIIPDTTLYDHVDYADNEVLFESADLAIKMTGSANSMLRDIVAMIPKKIKQLNKLEAQILSAVDNIDILVAPDVFEYVHIDDFNNFSVELKKVDVNGKLSKYRKCFGKAIKNIMEYYSMLLLRVLMSARKLLAIRTGDVNEGVYKLSIAKHKFQFSDMLCESSDDPYIYMPLFDEDGYQSIAECAHDVQLYQAAGGRLEDIQFSTALTESADTDFSELGVAISDRSGTTEISRDTSEVFFTKRITPSSLIDLFNCIYASSDLPDHWRTMVKISTGEPGGHNYLKPELIGDLVKQINGIICDTVTAYDGNRDTKEKQLKTMKDHGFTRIGEVDVLDGDGELVIPVKDGYMLQNVNAGKDLLNFDFHVVLSHFKGHQMAGYGGAIKNVAIGCASRRGKSQIHTYGSTTEMTVGFLDQYDQQSFLKAMVDTAKSFIDAMKIKGPVLYINVANNLSVDCDCIAQPEKPTMADIGIFASWDPVAVDSACIDAVYYAKDSQDLVERIESKDGTDILLYAEESGIGSRSYKLINIDHMNESSKVYNTTSDIGPMDREEKEKVAEKYGLRAVGQELPSKEEERRKTPEQRYEERNKKRNAALKKARKAKKRKAFVRKLKSHLPGVKNEEAELIRESNSVVDASDVSIPDGVEHSSLYGDRKHFFYNYDMPKETNTSAEKLDEMAYEDYCDHFYMKLKSLANEYNKRDDIFKRIAKILKMDQDKLPKFDCHVEVSGEKQLCFSMINPDIPFEIRCEYEKYLKEMIAELEKDKEIKDKYPYVTSIWTADAEGSIYIDLDYENMNEAAIKMNDMTKIVALNNELNDYQYGLSRDNQKIKKQNTTSEDYDKYYRVATPAQFVKQNGGICWDFATYEASVFKKQFPNIKFKTYYIVFEAAPYYPTHTFLVFEKDMKFYYFESSFKRVQGIWVADSISDIFNFVLHSMDQYHPKDYKASLLKYKYAIFEYNALHPDIPGSTTVEFMNLMEEIGQEIPHVYHSKYDVKPYIDTDDLTVRKTKTKNENDSVSSEAVKLDFYLNKEHIAEASISAVDTDKGFLYDLEVFKKYRGQGNGTKVMQYILSHYKVSDLSVDANNTPAIKLYTKFGFKRKKSFYDKTQKKTFDWYQREPVLLDESVYKSTVDPNHKQKGHISLSSLDKVEVTEKWRKEHTAQYPWLRHVPSADKENDVSVWMKDGELVAAISVNRSPSKRNKIWIHNIHVETKYRGYGLSKQLLDYAIRNYGANALAVKIDNKVAQKVYLDYGFTFGTNKDDTIGNSKIMYINESSSENNLENVGELKVNGETLTIKRKVSENPNDPVSKLAHNLSFYLDDKKIANISISAVDSKKAFLYNFDVVSKYQGKGYGTAILKYVLSHYKVNELTVDKSNTRAIKLYKRFGFKTGVEFKEDGKTRIDMKINLNETSTKVDNEDPLTKKELAEYGIRDLYTFQRWMKNNVRYKNMTNLMTPREVLEQKVGSCHDQVVLELAVLKTLGYHPTAYFVLEHDNRPSGSQGGETHSYVVVKDNGKQYWFENAWSRYAGLHVVTDPKFIKKMHEERSWGDSNKFSELEVVRFAGEPGDSLQDLVDHCFNDKQEINEGVVGNLVKDLPAIMKNAGANAMYTGKWEVVEDGLMQLIQKADTMERVNYLRRDLRYGIVSMEKLLDKMYRVQKGELENKDIKKRIAGGNTPDKLKAHLKWIRNTGLPALNARAKEIRKALKESYVFELEDPNLKLLDRLDEAATDNKKLYPVYIMLVHSGTTVSNAIKFVSKSKFSHASISFDSSMDHMYSFARKDPSNPFFGGFRYESIGKGFYDKKEIPYALYVVPCTESQIKKMKKRLDYFIKNESKFQFDFAGLVKNYLGIVDNPEYRWFCSRFVADILNAGAPKNKPYVAEPSLQDPDDFMRNEYATYVIGGDNLMKYNRSLVDKRTRKIIREEEMARSVNNESAIYDMDWNNPYAEQVLDYQLSCMDESIVHDFMNYLKSYKLKFDNDGNIIIRRREYDQLDAHFRASVKLIKASEKAGDWETVKAELAKLYYMSGLIYEQCDRKQSKKSTPHVREDLMDLRSVILNVFQQHLKTVMNHDPKFNFNAYYETTKYSRDTTIPKAVLTSLGKTVITLLS